MQETESPLHPPTVEAADKTFGCEIERAVRDLCAIARTAEMCAAGPGCKCRLKLRTARLKVAALLTQFVQT